MRPYFWRSRNRRRKFRAGSREFTQDSSGSEDVEAARRMVEEMKRGISPGHAAEDSRKVIGKSNPWMRRMFSVK
ncbi:MAG: hypothetical protein ACLUKN_14865 [Bacilli bacterium]